MSVASCIYWGTIRHRRYEPWREFRHRLALAYIDLDELPGLLGGRLLTRSAGVLRFRRRDYLGDPTVPLQRAVRDTAEQQTGVRPAGPIRLLTQLRSWGHCFNPVSFYYCLDSAGSHLDTLLAEVTNTPWGQRHAYVMRAGCSEEGVATGEFEKALHVSPFMGMDQSYVCRAALPGDTLSVHIESRQSGGAIFDATLALRRRELTRVSLARMAACYPLANVRVLALIYAHGLRLRLAGVEVHRHPGAGGA